MEVISMKSYSVAETTKLQREKYANDAIALSTLDAQEPSEEAKSFMQEYIDGKCELSNAIDRTIERYRVAE
jgi:hypothetical protein